jgi:hypothetical protein
VRAERAAMSNFKKYLAELEARNKPPPSPFSFKTTPQPAPQTPPSPPAPDTPPLPSADEFRDAVRKAFEEHPRHPRFFFLVPVLTLQHTLYRQCRHLLTPHLYKQLLNACVDGLKGFADALPETCIDVTGTPTPFTTTLGDLVPADYQEGLAPAYEALAVPFRGQFEELASCWKMTPEFGDKPNWKDFWNGDEDQKSVDRAKKEREKEYKEWLAFKNEVYDTQPPLQKALYATPYWKENPVYLAPDPTTTELVYLNKPELRFSTTWICAYHEAGKTNLLLNMVADDLTRGDGTIIVMDSKGDLINTLARYPDAVIIDYKNIQINPLQLGSSARTIEFLEYLFSSLLETSMTQKQATLFSCVLEMLLNHPNATIETFRDVLRKGTTGFEAAIAKTNPVTREFFEGGKTSEFNHPDYRDTKAEVLWRLRSLLRNEYLRNIFTTEKSSVDFFKLLDSKKLIIIDNSKEDLGELGCEFFGRLFIALVLMGALTRSRLKPEDKVPVYFYLDECQTVISRDTKIPVMIDECRSQKIALTLAHQRLARISPAVLDAMFNASIRIANVDNDAKEIAPHFRTTPEQLQLKRGEFALFVRHQTKEALRVTTPLFDELKLPRPLLAERPVSTRPEPKPKPQGKTDKKQKENW